MADEMKNVSEKVRYSDEELQEFKAIIIDMLEKAKVEYKHLRNVITHDESNDIEDTSPTFIFSFYLRVMLLLLFSILTSLPEILTKNYTVFPLYVKLSF